MKSEPHSLIAQLLEHCSVLPQKERSLLLEESVELEEAYATVARQGNSKVPENAEDEVEYHYVCSMLPPASIRRSPDYGQFYSETYTDSGTFWGKRKRLPMPSCSLSRS